MFLDVGASRTRFIVADEKLLCTAAGDVAFFTETELAHFAEDLLSRHILDERLSIQVVAVSHQKTVDGLQWLGLRSQLARINEHQFQQLGRALQIVRWHFDHQFCGRCGKPTQDRTDELAKRCATCNIDFYPRLSPCVLTLVTRRDECLLAWHKRSAQEIYTCLSGFIEVGESPEQTIVREVMEEVGVRVDNIRYVGSQPWPFPGQLMLGYTADYVDGDVVADDNEIMAAGWFKYDQLPPVPPTTTLSGQLINTFVQQRKSHYL